MFLPEVDQGVKERQHMTAVAMVLFLLDISQAASRSRQCNIWDMHSAFAVFTGTALPI